jgi:hypothetical protein
MPNQLNIISPTIRDFLLSKNLIVAESIQLYGGGLSIANGLGTIAQTELPSINVIDSPDIINSAELIRNNNIRINKYEYNSPTEGELYSADFRYPEYYSNPVNGGYDTGMPSKDGAPNPTKPDNLLISNKENNKARAELLSKNLLFSETITKYGIPSDNSIINDFKTPVDIEQTFSNVIDSPDIIDLASKYKPEQLKNNKYNSGDVSNDELYSTILSNTNYLKSSINGPYIIGDSGEFVPNPNSKDSLLLNNTINNDRRTKILGKNLNLSEVLSNYSSNILPDLNQDRGQEYVSSNNSDSVINSGIDIVSDGTIHQSFNTLLNRYKPDSSNQLYDTTLNYSNDYNKTITNEAYATSTGLIDPNNTLSLKSDVIDTRLKSVSINEYSSPESIIEYDAGYPFFPTYGVRNEDYLDYMKGINNQLGISTAGNIIGSLLSGQGVGFSPNGAEPNFDLKTSIAGRVLGATGIINDTGIGKAAQSGLAFAMLNNIAFNTEKNTIGLINTDITSLIAGAPLIGKNYKITNTGIVSNLLEMITGAQLPKSLLPNDATIFYFNDKSKTPLINLISNGQSLYPTVGQNQSLIDNTGNGQWETLYRNLNANNYTPGYIKGKESLPNNHYLNESNDYDGTKDLSFKPKSNKSNDYDGTKDLSFDLGLNEFTWPDSGGNIDTISNTWKNQNSLLKKTQDLFKSKKIQTPINNISGTTIGLFSDIDTGVGDFGNIVSKGNQVLSSDGKTFCRTWSTLNRYGENLNTLQRHRGIDAYGGIRLSDVNSSVLDRNGFVRIAPTSQQKDMKRFMFSLENLAWSDNLSNLRPCEVGPGDVLNGKQGRIMWFPPYNLSFSETNNAKWDSTEFIGRGEPIYTYNNTERSGTLSFKVITDHSTTYNNFKKSAAADINRFIFGCDEIPAFVFNNLSPINKNNIDVAKAKNMQPQTKQIDGSHSEIIELYYINDISDPQVVLDLGYENNSGKTGIGSVMGEYGNAWVNKTYDELNEGFIDKLTNLVQIAATNDTVQIQILGYATEQGDSTNNVFLALHRATLMQAYIENNYTSMLSGNTVNLDNFRNNIKKKFNYVSVGINSGSGQGIISVPVGTDVDSPTAKRGRKCDISLIDNPSLSINNQSSQFNKNKETDNSQLPDGIESDLFCESSYFDYLYETSPLVYKSITNSFSEQIKHFQPGFHSITPEGFNERLNFLLQCTRQGPTQNIDGNPNNLAFGRPPVCILRIGDFYHTKIVIDSVNFEFNEVHWDLNPEGIGVQPMIVDVIISFKFIGGSSLNGPISKLQNAVSFNFFANTEMYDNRADRIVKDKLINGATSEEITMTRDDATIKNISDENQLNTSEFTNSIQNDKNDDIFIINHGGTQANNTLTATLDGNMLSIKTTLSSPNKDKLLKNYTVDYRINKDIIRQQVNLTHSDGKINGDLILTFDWTNAISGLDLSRVGTYIDIDAYIQELDLSFIGNSYVYFNSDCSALNVNKGDFELVMDSEVQRLNDINSANTDPNFCSGNNLKNQINNI